jgi:site-specific recombinase XerC
MVQSCEKDININLTEGQKQFIIYRDKALIMIFYKTGFRLAEIYNLKIGDLSILD